MRCPACDSAESALLYRDAKDYFFGVTGGWRYDRCTSCGSVFLRLRPTSASIARAYATYYTHLNAEEPDESSLRKHLLAAGSRAYLARTHGVPSSGSTAALWWLPHLVPGMASHLDWLTRVGAPPFKGARLLDLGCGNGGFVKLADLMGWSGVGLDSDPKAVAAAVAEGVDARVGRIEDLEADLRFDAITLSHVIEHVHDPVAVLRKCRARLVADGLLWIETPNAVSDGHRRFGRYWRGLEAPRHLCIFSPKGLASVLERAGFSNLSHCQASLQRAEIFRQSLSAQRADSPAAVLERRTPQKTLLRLHEVLNKRNVAWREFITVSARPRASEVR
jgi:2-polyprenyl-3-methyl-5-hydroxy-6-metoxy-1,4-benzoquinol methylase